MKAPCHGNDTSTSSGTPKKWTCDHQKIDRCSCLMLNHQARDVDRIIGNVERFRKRAAMPAVARARPPRAARALCTRSGRGAGRVSGGEWRAWSSWTLVWVGGAEKQQAARPGRCAPPFGAWRGDACRRLRTCGPCRGSRCSARPAAPAPRLAVLGCLASLSLSPAPRRGPGSSCPCVYSSYSCVRGPDAPRHATWRPRQL